MRKKTAFALRRMLPRRFWFALSLALAAGAPLRADQLILTNGDRITGTILRLEAETVDLESELLGEVTARWEAVSELSSDAPLYVTFSEENQLLVGRLSLTEEEMTVETADAGTVRIEKAEITAIRSEAEQAAYLAEVERLGNPGLTDLWAAAVDAGLSLTRGNAETKTVDVGMRTARTTERDRISLYFTSVFADNSTSGLSITTANTVRGGSRYEVNLSDRWFTFGFTDLEFDEFQDLDLRFVLGGGMGLNLRETAQTAFQIFGGGSLNEEFYSSAPSRKSGEAVLGESWSYELSDRLSFSERLALYPNLTTRGEYRITFDSTITTEINDWLGWQVTLSDRYISNPASGRRQNDLLFTTGVRLRVGGSVGGIGPGSLGFR